MEREEREVEREEAWEMWNERRINFIAYLQLPGVFESY